MAKKSIIKKEEVKKNIEVKNKYKIISILYFACSIMWLVEGYIKYLNKINNYCFNYLIGVILLLLGAYYAYRIKKMK